MIRLHHVPFSRSFRVLWFLEELGLDFEIVYHSITKGTMRSDDYLQKAPLGRAPALEIDGRVMTESGPICQYLAENYGWGRFGRGAGHSEWPRYLEWISFAETMANQIEQLNLQCIFLRPPAKPSEVVVKLNRGRLRATIAVLEQAVSGQEWVLPQGFSAVDAMMGFNIFAAPHYVSLDDFPCVRAYQKRIGSRPAYQAARAKDGPSEFVLSEET